MALKIGELLVSKKLITKSQVDKALESQRIYGGKLGTNLVELGFVTDEDLASVLGEQLRMPAATLQEFEQISNEALSLARPQFAKEHRLIPLTFDKRIRVAICDPGDVSAIDELAFQTGKAIQAVIAPEIWIISALERYYNVPRDTRYVRMSDSDVGLADSRQITYDISTEVEQDYEGKFDVMREEIPMSLYVKRLLEASTKEEVFEALLDVLGLIFPRMAVYVVRKDHFSGWILRGFPIRDRDFVNIKVPFSEETVLKTVVTKGIPFRGEIERTKGHELGFKILDIDFYNEVRLFPVVYRAKIIAVLMGVPDEQRRSVSKEDAEKVTISCKKAGMALELISLRQRILTVPAAE